MPAICDPASAKLCASGSHQRTAIPSIITRSNGGWSRSAKIGWRSTRPAAASSLTGSTPNNGVCAAISASASATLMRSVIGRRDAKPKAGSGAACGAFAWRGYGGGAAV